MISNMYNICIGNNGEIPLTKNIATGYSLNSQYDLDVERRKQAVKQALQENLLSCECNFKNIMQNLSNKYAIWQSTWCVLEYGDYKNHTFLILTDKNSACPISKIHNICKIEDLEDLADMNLTLVCELPDSNLTNLQLDNPTDTDTDTDNI